MSTEGHNCWEDCDEGPHGCVCGNDCAPPRWMTEQDEREALAREAFRLFEEERPRIDRSRDLAHILIEHGFDPEAEAVEDIIAAITRWADAHVAGGLEAIAPLLHRQGQITEAMVDVALSRFGEQRDETWRDAMRAALEAAEEARRVE